MVIVKKHEPSQTAFDINGHFINTTEELKLLGVTITKEMHFSKHISIICNKSKQINRLHVCMCELSCLDSE